MPAGQWPAGKRFAPELIRRFSDRLSRQLGLHDLDELAEQPFAWWLRWYQSEAEEPFLDRRIDLQAFLICRVLAAVWQRHILPTEEMFCLSAPLSPRSNSDAEEEELQAQERSFATFDAKMSRSGY